MNNPRHLIHPLRAHSPALAMTTALAGQASPTPRSGSKRGYDPCAVSRDCAQYAWSAPDVTFEAQQRAWLDAAAQQDDKWDLLLGEVMPEAGRPAGWRRPDSRSSTPCPPTRRSWSSTVTTASWRCRPTSLPSQTEPFYLAGGYKYAMAGEGALSNEPGTAGSDPCRCVIFEDASVVE